eukprot:scaffold833_cov352-Pavlova_lutheri.AAC.4
MHGPKEGSTRTARELSHTNGHANPALRDRDDVTKKACPREVKSTVHLAVHEAPLTDKRTRSHERLSHSHEKCVFGLRDADRCIALLIFNPQPPRVIA